MVRRAVSLKDFSHKKREIKGESSSSFQRKAINMSGRCFLVHRSNLIATPQRPANNLFSPKALHGCCWTRSGSIKRENL
jgi:hypothetical protein